MKSLYLVSFKLNRHTSDYDTGKSEESTTDEHRLVWADDEDDAVLTVRQAFNDRDWDSDYNRTYYVNDVVAHIALGQP